MHVPLASPQRRLCNMTTSFKTYTTYGEAEQVRKSRYEAAMRVAAYEVYYGVHMLEEGSYVLAEHDTKTQAINKYLTE